MNTDIAHCEASSASVPPHIVTNYIFTELQLPIHHTVKTPAQIIIIHIALHWIGLDWIELTTPICTILHQPNISTHSLPSHYSL